MSKTLNIGVIVEAKNEYTEQLKSIVTPLVIQGVNSIYQDALKVSEGKNVIMTFQQFLKDVTTWNQTILQEEAKRIKKKCPYIMDIVTAIFVSSVKILASIRLKGNNDNIKVKIPSCELFIHSVYIESAQQIFYDPMLFYHKTNNFNQVQKNKRYVKEIIENAVEESIRKMMPFDHILEEYLKNALDDNAEYTDSDESEEESEDGDILNNEKIIDEPEEEPENENETTKNLHIDGLNSYVKENNINGNLNGNLNTFQPPPYQPQNNIVSENVNNNNFGSDSGSSSYSSGSDSGSESDSSSSSSSSGSSRSSRSSGSSRAEHPERKDHQDHHQERHRRHERHEAHRKEEKKKYSFF